MVYSYLYELAVKLVNLKATRHRSFKYKGFTKLPRVLLTVTFIHKKMNYVKKYHLVEKSIPDIEGDRLRYDPGHGGQVLVYRVTKFKRIKLFNKIWVTNPIPTSVEYQTFLNPYKRIWGIKNNGLSKNDWGKKYHPLTALWLHVDNTLDDLKPGNIMPIDVIKDHRFIKNLKQQKSFFKQSILN